MKKILPFLLVALIFSACTQDNIEPIQTDESQEIQSSRLKALEDGSFCSGFYDLVVVESEVTTFPGSQIEVWNDGINLFVTLTAPTDWYLYASAIYVGGEEFMPVYPGSDPGYYLRINGIAQHNLEVFLWYTSSYTYVLPLPEDECFAISAFVKFYQEVEEGDPYGVKGNYTYTQALVYCDEECETPCYGEETAWSDGTTFTTLTGTKRWGWYSEYTIGQANEYTIYAGQTNDIGTLYVSDDGDILTVTYQTDGGAVMGLAHLYVGNVVELQYSPEKYMNKKGTPVPGQFPYTDSSDPYTDTFTFSIPFSDIDFGDDDTNLIIAAHAEAYLPTDCE